jgi:hypothetical protein
MPELAPVMAATLFLKFFMAGSREGPE